MTPYTILLKHTVDNSGTIGGIVQFMYAAALFGSSVLIFLYLWKKGRLDFDQGPANQMLDDDEEKSNE